MKIFVELLGWLRQDCDSKIRAIDVKNEVNVIELLQELQDERFIAAQAIVSDTLILVNEREISVLNGLETLLSEGDKVTIIPVSHGG